ncbi:phosphorylase superfamily domain-containing protein [Trichoderma breve]|uniref:Phosphorylase superfamily domain-containing protein n=1 Tax=Trichoderma breve TaxID=2034170 RepID=A0A9W9E3P5_9HYPO|nr:phosphorylase superfamily domain-containing protein [Trichoderma breve]KAJ4855397.1 phosphorylase superfamily domain-containing protein [Trichoderma breve]
MGGVISSPNNSTDSDDCLKLVLYTLPILKELISHLEKSLDPRDRRYGYLGNIYTAATVLNGHLGAIREAEKTHWFVGQIASLADLLEEVFDKVIDFALLQKEHESHDPSCRHPRLRAMQKLVPMSDNWKEGLARLHINPIENQTIAWGSLQDALERLSDELQRFGDDVPSIDRPQPPMTSLEPSGELVAFADRVFSSVHVTCNRCGGAPQRETYQCVCTLLDTHSKSRSEFWRLNIILDPIGEGMQSHKPDERRHKRETLQEEVDLNTLIASQAKRWTAMAKFTLSLTLCYSLFHFYGGSWTKERWSRKNIVFFGDGTQFPLRPFLSSDPQKLGGPLYDPDGYHKYPEFLELGVTLLEIHLGQKLESYLGYEEDITNYDDLWCKALELFKELRPDFISTVYRDAIQKCLMANFSISDTCDERMLRESLFNDIVKPLETEVGTIFKEFLSMDALDEEAERKINLGSKVHNMYHRPHAEITKTLSPQPNYDDVSSLLDKQHTSPQPQKAVLTISTIRSRPASRDDFEIAIVCALPLEYDAVCILIDEFWDEDGDQYGKATRDPNIYTTGRIGKHNIVLVLLPDMGKVGAASAAASLRLSFPELKLLLLTGICGGVPGPGTAKELVLGDVVLSTSVFQYDFGRRHGDKFVPKDTSTDSLGRPSKDIRSLLKICDTNRGRRQLEKQAAFYLEHIQNSASTEHSIEQYLCPGAANDKLFETTYVHKHNGEPHCLCRSPHETCDKRRIKHKLQLEQQGRHKEAQAPAILLGSIGSGDTVMRSSQDRDRIAEEHDLIAFEMEGAGAWDELPCIVVKGICDYADSHKNKMWQNFAAATAASVMKALLEKYT